MRPSRKEIQDRAKKDGVSYAEARQRILREQEGICPACEGRRHVGGALCQVCRD